MDYSKVFKKAITNLSCITLATAISIVAHAEETIKVGILHSLSGTMALSETVLKNTALMTIEEINAQGGILGKKLEPIIVNSAAGEQTIEEKARQLLTENKVSVIFGCWTSSCRQSVLPVLEELNGLMFYPLQYEGLESSKNIYYTGSVPNQQAIPALEYLMNIKGGSVKRFYLLGTDYSYPRTTNRILRAYLRKKGVKQDDIIEEYTPFAHDNYQTIVDKIRAFAEDKKTAVISTVNGDSSIIFYRELANQGVTAADIPVMAFSISEQEIRSMNTAHLVGHLASWSYFMSVDNEYNKQFIEKYKNWAKRNNIEDNENVVTNDPMEATYMGIKMWATAVHLSGSADVDKVTAMLDSGRIYISSPSGYKLKFDVDNHHLRKPVMIGEVLRDGQFNLVYKTPQVINPQPWSPYVVNRKSR